MSCLTNLIKYVWIFGCIILGEARYVDKHSKQYPMTQLTDTDTKKCSSLLVKALTDLLLSEYNRVSSANHALYFLSRDPSVICKENDMMSCAVSVEIVPSNCHRLAQKIDCQPEMGSREKAKACIGVINPSKGEIIRRFVCEEEFEDQNLEEIFDLEDPDSTNNIGPPSLQNMMKKQPWGGQGGNIYPF